MSVGTSTTEISTNAFSNIVPLNIANRRCNSIGVNVGGIHHDTYDSNNDDDDVFGNKIMISVHRGKKTITKIPIKTISLVSLLLHFFSLDGVLEIYVIN